MLFHNAKIEDVAKWIHFVGMEAFLKMVAQLPAVGAKNGERSLGQVEAFLNLFSHLPVEEQEAVLRGERKLVTEEVVRLLINCIGRAIPEHLGLKSKVKNEDASFTIETEEQPKINYAEILSPYLEAFHEFPELKFLSATEFEDNAEKKKERLLDDGLISNLVKRAHMPIPTPHLVVSDYGKVLQEIFLKILEEVYKKKFSDRGFNNYRNNELEKKVSIVKGVGYENFISLMAGGPDALWYFPRALQGFSFNAAREAMNILTQHSLMLSGAISTTLGIIGNVDKMAGSFNTPGYDCSAVAWQSADWSLYCGADDAHFYFGRTGRLADASGSDSSGLLFR